MRKPKTTFEIGKEYNLTLSPHPVYFGSGSTHPDYFSSRVKYLGYTSDDDKIKHFFSCKSESDNEKLYYMVAKNHAIEIDGKNLTPYDIANDRTKFLFFSNIESFSRDEIRKRSDLLKILKQLGEEI